MAVAVMRLLALLIAAGTGAAALAAGETDPTQPPPGYGPPKRAGDAPDAAPAPTPVRLQMVARDGSQRLAVVNGRRVRQGDALLLDGKQAKVVAIGDDSIVLDRDGHHQTLSLTPRKEPR